MMSEGRWEQLNSLELRCIDHSRTIHKQLMTPVQVCMHGQHLQHLDDDRSRCRGCAFIFAVGGRQASSRQQ
jgi:hypothetical protein